MRGIIAPSVYVVLIATSLFFTLQGKPALAQRTKTSQRAGEQVKAERVASHFSYLLKGNVERYLMPGMHALNFVMTQSLGGGGVASLRYDPQGKAFAQMLLDMTIKVPAALLDAGKVS